MRISNSIGLGLLVVAGTIAAADNVALTEDSRITGDVRSIDAAGIVEVASPLSQGPVWLNVGAVEKIEFAAQPAAPDFSAALLELVNGDLLPARLEQMDDSNLTVMTADAGLLTIPRASMKSLQLGVYKGRVLYSGPRSLAEWTETIDGSKGWKLTDDGLSASGSAVAAKDLHLPRQFTLKFTLKWQGNPNFQISFADPLTPKADAVDRYVMLFTSAGFEIRRESTKGKRLQPIMLPVRGAEQFYNHQVAVEIQVDRKSSRIHLLLNGEPESAGGIDPGLAPPAGSGVMISCMGPVGATQEITNIEVAELDNSSARHHSEERGDPKTDSLISRDDDRWGGRLTSIHNGPGGAVFSFKSDFQDQPLELSEADVSTVFFAKPEAAAAEEKPDGGVVLKLVGEGALKVSSCRLNDGNFTATHPLLGDLKIARKGVTALEKPKSQATKEAVR